MEFPREVFVYLGNEIYRHMWPKRLLSQTVVCQVIVSSPEISLAMPSESWLFCRNEGLLMTRDTLPYKAGWQGEDTFAAKNILYCSCVLMA